MSKRMPVYFISHGGGPWPYIPEMRERFVRTADWLSNLPKSLPEKPKAIVSISGHWEEDVFTVANSESPPMVYDYSGFPPHTYQISYKAPGSAVVAKRIGELLDAANLPVAEDPNQGFDHGTFVPLVLMYPNADVPVVSLSMKKNYSPSDHLALGRALAPLRDQGILILGSGLSYHNMRGFGSSSATDVAEQFGKWLADTVRETNSRVRDEKLIEWQKAPAARLAHPREDHLIPLMVIAGAAGDDPGQVAFVDHVMNVDMASYVFGDGEKA